MDSLIQIGSKVEVLTGAFEGRKGVVKNIVPDREFKVCIVHIDDDPEKSVQRHREDLKLVDKTIFDLELHERSTVNDIQILRVPGGWIYSQALYPNATSTFVPDPPVQLEYLQEVSGEHKIKISIPREEEVPEVKVAESNYVVNQQKYKSEAFDYIVEYFVKGLEYSKSDFSREEVKNLFKDLYGKFSITVGNGAIEFFAVYKDEQENPKIKDWYVHHEHYAMLHQFLMKELGFELTFENINFFVSAYSTSYKECSQWSFIYRDFKSCLFSNGISLDTLSDLQLRKVIELVANIIIKS